jgi:hypothetical protein
MNSKRTVGAARPSIPQPALALLLSPELGYHILSKGVGNRMSRIGHGFNVVRHCHASGVEMRITFLVAGKLNLRPLRSFGWVLCGYLYRTRCIEPMPTLA